MNTYARFHNALHVSAVTGILLFTAASGSIAVALLGLPLVALAWYLFRRTTRSPVPRVAINIALALATLLMIIRVIDVPADSISTLAYYLVGLLLIKLFEHRTPRDQAQSLALGAMLAVGAVLTDVRLATGVMLLVHLGALLVASLRYQLYAGRHAVRAAPNVPIEAEALAERAGFTSLRGVAVLLGGPIVLGAVAVFLLLPRFEIGAQRLPIGLSDVTPGRVSGLSDQVQLGASGLIESSRELVAEVEIIVDGVLAETFFPRYLRANVLDRYDSRGRGLWSRSPALEIASRASTPIDRDTLVGDEILQNITLRRVSTSDLFAVAMPLTVSVDSRRDIRISSVARTLSYTRRRARLGLGDTYTVLSMPEAASAWDSAAMIAYRAARDEEPDPFRDGAVGERLNEIAVEILARVNLERDPEAPPSAGDRRIISVLRNHLRERCAYTTTMVAPEDDTDPTLYFLETSRRGHCEYFASALAGLCRSIGIDARVVTGYVTSEYDSSRGRYMVRRSHAHAWVEAPVVERIPVDDDNTIERVVWRTFDASPAAGVDGIARPEPSLFEQLSDIFVAFENAWFSSVIRFDEDAQSSLFGIGEDERAGGMLRAMDEWLVGTQGHSSEPPGWSGLITPALALFGVGGLVYALRTLLRPGAERRRVGQRRRGRVDRALRRLGAERPRHRAYREHAHEIGGETGRALAGVADAIYATRFGGRDDDGSSDRAIVALEALTRTRRRGQR